MPKKTASVEVIATVASGHLSRIGALADELKAAGLDVSHTLASTGMIAGSAPPGALARLRQVKGVVSVETAGGVQIAPPDSDVQ